MKILLIEDDENKRRRISETIAGEIPEGRVIEARSLHSAQTALESGAFDVIIMDMSIPTFDVGPDELGGSFVALGGLELVRYMDRYQVVAPVIVLTQFNNFGSGKDALTLTQLDAQLATEFKRNYMGVIFYDSSVDDWKGKLLNLLRRVDTEGTTR